MTSTEETRFKLWHRSRSCLIWGDFSVEKSLFQNKKMAPRRDTAGPHKTPFGNKELTVVGSHVEVQKVARLLSYINKSRPRLPPIQKMAGLSGPFVVCKEPAYPFCYHMSRVYTRHVRLRLPEDNIVCLHHQVRGSPKITHGV